MLMDAALTSRLEIVCYVLAALVALGVIVCVSLPERARSRRAVFAAVRYGFVYLTLGLVTRFVVQHHRSRLQILLLLMLVAIVEVYRFRRADWKLRGTTWLTGSAAVCLGVLMAKWSLEPGAITAALEGLHGRVLQ